MSCFPSLKKHLMQVCRRVLPLELWQESPVDLPHLPVYAKALHTGGWSLPTSLLNACGIDA